MVIPSKHIVLDITDIEDCLIQLLKKIILFLSPLMKLGLNLHICRAELEGLVWGLSLVILEIVKTS